MKTHANIPFIGMLRGAVLCTALFSLQAAGAPQTGGSDPLPVSGPIVELSRFEVREQPNRGYIANESLTGTRIPTEIRDLPFVVNTVTSEFLDDFAFLEINDNLGYTSTLNGFEQSGSYNLRGFGASNMLRNGFFRLGMVDRVNVDRIEILKGPNAVMYGQTQPSGLLNVITKKPRKKPEQRFTLTFGSFDQWRGDLSLTGPVPKLGKTYYRLSAAAYDRGYEYARYARLRTRTASLAIQHEFEKLGTITAEFEYMSRDTTAAQQGAAYTYDPSVQLWRPVVGPNGKTSMTPAIYYNTTGKGISGKRYLGVTDVYTDYEPNGSDSHSNRDVTNITLVHEKSYNSVFSSRIAGNWYTRHLHNFNNTGISYYNIRTGLMHRGDPNDGIINENGGGAQADFLAHYWLADGRIENKSMITVDYSTYWRYDPTRRLAAAYRADPDYYVKLQDPQNPDRRIPPDDTNTYFTELTRWDKNRVDVIGTLLRHQASFLSGRVIGYAGVRFDKVKFTLRERDYNATYNPEGYDGDYHYSVTATSPMFGANVKVLKTVSVYANWSKSFDPRVQSTFARDIYNNNGTPLPSETADGWDYGVKCGFFDDRLSFTAGGFYINRQNIKVTDVDEDGNTVTIAGGDQLVRGIELDATWRVTDNFTTVIGYGHVDSRQVNVGRDIDALGRPPKNLPSDTFYTALKYDFRNTVLKGFTANLGVRYVGRMATANPTDGDLVEPDYIGAQPNPNAGLVLRNDGRRDIYTPGYTLVEFGIRYRVKKGSITHTFGLNVSNALNETKGYLINRRAIEGSSAVCSYTIAH